MVVVVQGRRGRALGALPTCRSTRGKATGEARRACRGRKGTESEESARYNVFGPDPITVEGRGVIFRLCIGTSPRDRELAVLERSQARS